MEREKESVCREKRDSAIVQKKVHIRPDMMVCLQDLDTCEMFRFVLSSPESAAACEGRLSVATSLGTALLGRRQGDIFKWQAPSRPRWFSIEKIFPL